jgi:hypothetical protein
MQLPVRPPLPVSVLLYLVHPRQIFLASPNTSR